MQDWFLQQNIEIQILIVTFGFSLLLQLFYFWVILGKVAFWKQSKKSLEDTSQLPPVSVIIVAENEYHYLRKNLPVILKQDYPDYQVVVINNDIQDNISLAFWKTMENQYPKDRSPQFKIVNLPEIRSNHSRKKFMLDLGVKEAKHDILLFTNPDCQPDSPHWIRLMVASLQGKKKIALGYCGMSPVTTNRFYRLDMLISSATYLSLARCGMPYTGSGNNMAYTRDFFTTTKGHLQHYAVPYGDDAIFINKNATKSNTKVVLDATSLMRSNARINFRHWMYQKKSARLSQRHYKQTQRFILSIFPFSRVICYATFICLLYLLPLTFYYYVIIGIFALRMISQLEITHQTMKRFHEKGLLFFAPLFEPCYMFLSWVTFFKALFYRRK
jgi:hypothetical protein